MLDIDASGFVDDSTIIVVTLVNMHNPHDEEMDEVIKKCAILQLEHVGIEIQESLIESFTVRKIGGQKLNKGVN